MQKSGKILILALCFSVFLFGGEMALSAVSNDRAGFIKGSIWYSTDKIEEGAKIKIYSFVFNPEDRELRGTVIFFDKSVFLGKADFSAPPRGVKNISIDWTATAGAHEIFAKIENARFVSASGKIEEVYLIGNETERSEIKVDKKILIKTDTKTELKNEAKAENAFEDPPIPQISLKKTTEAVLEATPDFIEDPIVSGAEKLETLRENMSKATDNKKVEVKKELEKSKKEEETKKKENFLLKPWRQVELFFLTVFSYIFSHKILFYLFWLLLIILIIRLLRKIF